MGQRINTALKGSVAAHEEKQEDATFVICPQISLRGGFISRFSVA